MNKLSKKNYIRLLLITLICNQALFVLASETPQPLYNPVIIDVKKIEKINNDESQIQYLLSIPISSTSSANFLVDQYDYSSTTSRSSKRVRVFDLEIPEQEISSLYNSRNGIQYPFQTTTESNASSTTIYAGSLIDTTYSPLPTPTQYVMPPVSYPYLRRGIN